ncbi:MAG TPA: YkgJ family cysteine cluster protein [Candidatus Altiarchaeales archaeon]|nr:YkgJ family cysteine cluster protein [Candidatus Altiarchaeales archaeon]
MGGGIEVCRGCSLCCRHLTTQIDAPEDREGFENIRWFLLHKGVKVFIDDEGDWYLEFKTTCNALTEEGLCGIYETRPDICRRYETVDCEKHGDYWEELFEKPEDLEAYLKREGIVI